MYYINIEDNFLTRFDLAKFLNYENNCYDVLTSYVLENICDLSIFETNRLQVEEQRPDLISWNTFDTTQYWWVIMLFNNFIFLDELVDNVKYNIPSLSELEDMYFSLKSLEQLNIIPQEELMDTTTIVHVSGTIITKEIPTGAINGSNQAYLLEYTPITDTEEVYLNGLLQHAYGNDYTLSGKTITFVEAPYVGSKIFVTYITLD